MTVLIRDTFSVMKIQNGIIKTIIICVFGSHTACARFDPGGIPLEEPDAYYADAQPVQPSCEAYCATVYESCKDDYQQFADVDACLDYCKDVAGWELGTADDTAVNTVGCRTYHAAAAAADPGLHCVHAGPTGGDACGSLCVNYCDLTAKNCTDDNALYEGDRDACLAACAELAYDGHPGDIYGDTVQCRLYHAAAAYENPGVHCAHADEDGGGVCVQE